MLNNINEITIKLMLQICLNRGKIYMYIVRGGDLLRAGISTKVCLFASVFAAEAEPGRARFAEFFLSTVFRRSIQMQSTNK